MKKILVLGIIVSLLFSNLLVVRAKEVTFLDVVDIFTDEEKLNEYFDGWVDFSKDMIVEVLDDKIIIRIYHENIKDIVLNHENGVISYSFSGDLNNPENHFTQEIVDIFWLKYLIQNVLILKGYTEEDFEKLSNAQDELEYINGLDVKTREYKEESDDGVETYTIIESLKINLNEFGLKNLDNIVKDEDNNNYKPPVKEEIVSKPSQKEEKNEEKTDERNNIPNPKTGVFNYIGIVTLGSIFGLMFLKRKNLIKKI